MFSTKYWIFFLIVIAAIGYSMIDQDPVANRTLITSPADQYQYRTLTLDNQLPVILVQAPNQKKAAASMTVKVGSGDDPSDRAGLAHFLEHMLFLGTEPYPLAGDYQNFISQNGGSHNAFTSNDRTTYFFEIDNDELSGALDRFAPFFISPTFDENFVDREMNAVHAEYSSKIKDDFRRIYSAEKQVLNPQHRLASFSTGNLETLADRPNQPIRDDLIQFYKQHYAASNMALVVAANYSLDELEADVRQRFSDIADQATVSTASDQPMFPANQLPLDLYIEPIKEIRRLQLTFEMPAVEQLYAYKPLSLLSNLIGHEGQGSLLAYLKSQGWAEGLSAGRSFSSANNSALTVQIMLTRQGLQNREAVTQAVFAYIAQLKQQPLPDYLVAEQRQLNELAFQFQEKGKLADYAVRLSSNLARYPMYDAIYGDYRLEIASQDLLAPFLDALSPDKMLRTIIAPATEVSIELQQRDPFYDTAMQYQASEFNRQLPFTNAELFLPKPNPYIPEDFSLQAEMASDLPNLLINETGRQVWFYPESDFQLPKGQVFVRLQSQEIQQSARNRVIAQLYARAVNEALNADSYPAYLAGLNYNLSASSYGIDINIGGYHDKLPRLLDNMLVEMTSIKITPEKLEQYKASLTRSYENRLKEKPFQRTITELKRWLFQPSFSETAMIEQITGVTERDINEFTAMLSEQLSSTTYIHGHISRDNALTIANRLNKAFPAVNDFPQLPDVVQAPVGKYQKNLKLDHPDSAITLYYQGHDTSDQHRAEVALLAQILSAPYYQRIRTEKQLGYIVFATPLPQQTVPAIALIVQSPTASPQQIIDQSQAFLASFAGDLAAMTESEFNQYRDGLITLLLERPKNMGDKAGKFWRDITIGRFQFNSNQAIADHVAQLTLEDIVRLYQLAMLDGDLPQILVSQGGKVAGFDQLKRLNRGQLPTFSKPSLQPQKESLEAVPVAADDN